MDVAILTAACCSANTDKALNAEIVEWQSFEDNVDEIVTRKYW